MDNELVYRSTKTYGHNAGLSCAFRQWKANSHCKYLHGYALSFKFVFEGKLKKLISHIEKELAKPKKERNKGFLKNSLKEAKTLKELVKECRRQKGEVCCPKCGHNL